MRRCPQKPRRCSSVHLRKAVGKTTYALGILMAKTLIAIHAKIHQVEDVKEYERNTAPYGTALYLQNEVRAYHLRRERKEANNAKLGNGKGKGRSGGRAAPEKDRKAKDKEKDKRNQKQTVKEEAKL